MNALVGKLVERNEDQVTVDLIKEGLLDRDALHQYSRRVKKAKHVGSLWVPEWAALILGKSRAIISEFVAKGSLMVSTDSVLLPTNVDISCNALVELESVGSTLKKEFDVSHGVIIRTRLYVLNPFESDGAKQRIARHGVHCSPTHFLEIMKNGFESKQVPGLTYSARRLVKYHDSIRKGKALNSEEIYESTINLKYDGKRKLLEPVDNPFASGSWSEPLSSIEIQNNRQRKAPKEKVGRKKGFRLDTEKRRAIVAMYGDGYKQVDICKELGLSKGYVSKVVNQIRKMEDSKCQKQQILETQKCLSLTSYISEPALEVPTPIDN